MKAAVLLYKGNSSRLIYLIAESIIRFRLFSKYSHAELMIGDVSYSSSARDGGVRSKLININSGNWDVHYFEMTEEEVNKALLWFSQNNTKSYDWINAIRYAIPFLRQSKDKFICFEAVAEMLGIPDAYDARPSTLIEYVKKRNSNESKSTESK